MIRDNQLPALIARLQGPNYKLVSNHPDPGGRRGLFHRRRIRHRQNLHRLRREFAPATSEDRNRRRYRLGR